MKRSIESSKSDCVAQKFVTTKHLKEPLDCKFCGFFHHKDTKCKLAPKDIEKTAKPEKKPKPKPKIKQGLQTRILSKHPVESQMEPGADTWTLVLNRNTPREIRDSIEKALDEFGISLE